MYLSVYGMGTDLRNNSFFFLAILPFCYLDSLHNASPGKDVELNHSKFHHYSHIFCCMRETYSVLSDRMDLAWNHRPVTLIIGAYNVNLISFSEYASLFHVYYVNVAYLRSDITSKDVGVCVHYEDVLFVV